MSKLERTHESRQKLSTAAQERKMQIEAALSVADSCTVNGLCFSFYPRSTSLTSAFSAGALQSFKGI